MTESPLVLVYVPNDALEAHVVVSALQHAGIAAELRPAGSSGFGAALPTLDRPPGVWVPTADVEAARSIIESAGDSSTGRLSLSEAGGELSGLEDS